MIFIKERFPARVNFIFLVIFLLASCSVQVDEEQPAATLGENITTVYETTATEIITTAELIVDVTEAETQEIITSTEEITTEVATTVPVTTTLEITTAAVTEPPETEPVTEPPPAAVSKNIPVFMYHTSSENNPGGLAELYVKPSEFEKQIKYIIDNGYTLCTFDDWYNLNNIDKPVFITFDDGYKENYTEIFPVLQKYNAKITIFLTIDNMAAENFTAEMIREMSDSGLVKFESHTISHPDLPSVSSNDERLIRELGDSKKQIEELTGKPVIALAYPGGGYNAKVIERARVYYKFGLTVIHGRHNTGAHSDFEIRRLRMNRSTSINAFINMLGG